MVLADEVNPVNRQYRELSNRYKAGWTFHRFMLGLRKFFGSQDLDDRTNDFRSLYQRLRDVSLRLDDMDIPPVLEELDRLRRQLDGLIESLDLQDAKISPSLVRLFFQRVKAQDERILIELIRFYLEAQRGRDWPPERTDKVDYLLSRLGHGIADPESGGDRERLRRVLAAIAEYTQRAVPVDPQKVANRMKLIQAVRTEIEQVETFDALTERDIVAHYRNLKHGLGPMVFEKSILPLIVSTNLLVAQRVTELTDAAQATIFQNYERVSALEQRGLLGKDVEQAVSQLHGKVGSFKKQVDSGTLRIDAIAEIRRSLQEIVARIGIEEDRDVEVDLGREELSEVESVFASAGERALLGSILEDLVTSLRETYRASGEARGLDSRLLEYRLAPREIEAFARLSSGAECETELEQLLLAGCCLRCKIKRLVDVLHRAGAEDNPGTRKAALADAAVCLRVGDLYVRRFDHFLEMKLAEGEVREMRDLRIPKMHLVREHTGLWLLVNEPTADGDA